MNKAMVSEEELISNVKPHFRGKGFIKKNKRWTKIEDDFTLVFFIQGSQWDKDQYYIRPGIIINSVDSSGLAYGHIFKEIRSISISQIFDDVETFFTEWTNKKLLKERALAFVEWEKRNPLEKRRAGEVDYSGDPVPAKELFTLCPIAMEYILKNY